MLEFGDEVKLGMRLIILKTTPCGPIAAFEENKMSKGYYTYQTIYAVLSSRWDSIVDYYVVKSVAATALSLTME